MTNSKNTAANSRISDEMFKAAIETAKTMPANMPEAKAARELTDATAIPYGAALGAVRAARKAVARDTAFATAKSAAYTALKSGKVGEDVRLAAILAAGNGAALLSANALEAAVGKARDVYEREVRIAAAAERFAREKAKAAANYGAGANYRTGKTERKRARAAGK